LLAAGFLTLTVSLVPAALLWIGRQFLAPSPLAAMRNHLDDLGRIAVAGVLIAFYLGAIGLAISSFTGRKSIAVGIIIIGFLMAEAISGALTFAFENNERARAWLGFLSPTRTTAALVGALWNVDAGGIDAPLPAIVGVMLAVIAICVGIMYGRYVPND
jgi:hypothetical protein